MMRSLSSGVSGMLTNQLAIDVTSNNLANTNTPGFKISRVNFANSLMQTTFAGSQPNDQVGGRNPRQVGLGTKSASIDVDMSQGPLQATGRDLDLAIQGTGFFEVSDGTRSYYSRVGNFELDSNNNLVQLGTGYRMIGNIYNLDVAPDGSQTIAQTNQPLEIPVDEAFPPSQTEKVGFQGNLDANTAALRGANLQSIFPLYDISRDSSASEDTLLRDLDIFTDSQVAPSPPNDTRTMYVFGTKPDGETYASTFEINPWATPVSGNNRGTVGELLENLNQSLQQGSRRFANARLENGNLLIESNGDGEGFSVFFGEGEEDYTTASTGGATGTIYSYEPATGADNPINGISDLDAGLAQSPTAFSFAGGPGSTTYTETITIGNDGLFDMPEFEFTGTAGDNFSLTISRSSATGTTTEESYSFTGTGAAQPFNLKNLFHVDSGDTVDFTITSNNTATYTLAGDYQLLDDSAPDLTHTIDYDFNKPGSISGTIATGTSGLLDPHFTVPFPDTGAAPGATTTLTQAVSISVRINGEERGAAVIPAGTYTNSDVEGRTFRISSFPHIEAGDEVEYVLTGSLPGSIDVTTHLIDDGLNSNLTNDAGLLEDGTPNMFQEGSGAHAWQYRNETNGTFDWYRSRLVPEFVPTSIEVFDAQGGTHNIEARFYRIGLRTEPGSGAKINSWDMIMNIDPGEGVVQDDVVSGIEFDQNGRFVGINATVFGTALNEASYRGNPASQTVRVDWATTGPQSPSTINMNFGEENTHNGLTGFGSNSTAAAVEQDGYGDGKLDSLTVNPNGDIAALYTNGISRNLAQVQLTTFRNPEGLTAVEDNLWLRSTASGDPVRRTAGQNAGFITAGALEGGNVDIPTEFTRLITYQRGFQISARVIQTTDKVLEEVANLTR